MLPEDVLAIRMRFMTDFEAYARAGLHIRTKGNALAPLICRAAAKWPPAASGLSESRPRGRVCRCVSRCGFPPHGKA